MMQPPAALQEPAVADSPVAQEVLRASAQTGAYPRFADIPGRPGDVRTPRAWAGAVQAVKGDEVQLQAQIAARPQVLFGTEAWAAEQAAAAAAPAPLTTTTTEEFLASTRKAAAPPSPPR